MGLTTKGILAETPYRDDIGGFKKLEVPFWRPYNKDWSILWSIKNMTWKVRVHWVTYGLLRT